MAKAGVITIDINAGTAQLLVDMEKSNAALQRFGQSATQAGTHTVSSMQASSAAIRLVEGNIFTNIRAVERFIGLFPGASAVLKAAFPLVGGIAFAALIAKMGAEVVEFFQKLEQAPERIAGAFRELNAPLKLTNDELALANDRLKNDIAKLEGKPQNGLAVALDEARVFADKLADSLDKDLAALNKLLKEEEVGFFKSLVSGVRTDDLRKQLGGETGHGGFTSQIDTITDAGNAKIDAGKTKAEIDSARRELAANLTAAYDAEIAKLTARLDSAKAQQAQRPAGGVAGSLTNAGLPGSRGISFTPDQTINIEETAGAIRNLQRQRNFISLSNKNEDLTEKKTTLEVSRNNAKAEDPFKNKIAELTEKVTAAQAKLATSGSDSTAKPVLKGYEEAIKAIEELERAHDGLSKKLTDSQRGQISLLAIRGATIEADADWAVKIKSVTLSTSETTAAQERLTAAIGKGYEAVRSANVETRVSRELGDKYGNKKFEGDESKLRTQFTVDFDAQHGEQLKSTTETIARQIEAENSLASAQQRGADAVRLVTLAYKLREVASAEGLTDVKKAIDAEIALADSEQRVVNLTTIENAVRAIGTGETPQKSDARAKILGDLGLDSSQEENRGKASIAAVSQQITATQRLTAAQVKGAEEVRNAELANRVEQITRTTPAGSVRNDQIRQATIQVQAEYQAAVTQEAVRTGISYQNQLQYIDDQIAALETIKTKEGDSLALEISLRNLRTESLRAQIAIGEQQGSNTSPQRIELANRELAETLRQWQQIGVGSVFASTSRALVQAPGAIGDSLASGIVDSPQRGESKLTEIGRSLENSLKNVGKNLLGDLITQAIDKLIVQLIGQATVDAILASSQTANTVAISANTVALGVLTAATAANAGASVAGGAASAAGGIAGAAGGIAAGAGSAATGGIIGPVIGGVISGVISATATLIGDFKIVKAINATTAAVNALPSALRGQSFGAAQPNGLTATDSKGNQQPAPTSSSSGSSQGSLFGFVASIFGGGSKPIDVNVVSISPLSPLKGLFNLFGFADGGTPPVGVPSIVGERGPEIFIPLERGAIIPNHMLKGYAGGAGLEHVKPQLLQLAGFDLPDIGGLQPIQNHVSENGPASNVFDSSQTTYRGDHTFNIYESTSPRETARRVAGFLKTQNPQASPFAR